MFTLDPTSADGPSMQNLFAESGVLTAAEVAGAAQPVGREIRSMARMTRCSTISFPELDSRSGLLFIQTCRVLVSERREMINERLYGLADVRHRVNVPIKRNVGVKWVARCD